VHLHWRVHGSAVHHLLCRLRCGQLQKLRVLRRVDGRLDSHLFLPVQLEWPDMQQTDVHRYAVHRQPVHG